MRRTSVALALLGLLAVVLPSAAMAQSDNTGTFQWLFGADLDPLLEDFGEGPFGPAVAQDKDGAWIEISGSGTFSIGGGPKDVTGGGDFAIFDADGTEVASGAWTATSLRGYRDWGFTEGVPEALRGGKLTMTIELDGVGTGKLTVHCLLGNPPPSKVEGVEVDVGSMHFHDTVPPPTAGATVFIRAE